MHAGCPLSSTTTSSNNSNTLNSIIPATLPSAILSATRTTAARPPGWWSSVPARKRKKRMTKPRFLRLSCSPLCALCRFHVAVCPLRRRRRLSLAGCRMRSTQQVVLFISTLDSITSLLRFDAFGSRSCRFRSTVESWYAWCRASSFRSINIAEAAKASVHFLSAAFVFELESARCLTLNGNCGNHFIDKFQDVSACYFLSQSFGEAVAK